MGIADHWLAIRNRLLASPRFQQFALDYWPFRLIARRRSRQLFDLLAGFAYSQVLYATVKLGLIEILAAGPLPAAAIAQRTGWETDRLERLLKAAVSLDLLEATSGGDYALGQHGAALAGNPWIAKFILHHHLLYEDLADPLALLAGTAAGGRLRGYWGYPGAGTVDAATAETYSALMAASQQAVTAEILAAYDFSRHTHLIDVGGGNGAFLAAAAAKHPKLMVTLFDLPEVAELARPTLASLGARAAVAGGSFLSDPLPKGPDVATLVRIAHDHDDASVLAILGNIRRMLPPHGALILAEPLSGIPSIAPVADAYFGLYFAAMGQGRARSAGELAELARQAGFGKMTVTGTRNPLVCSLLRFSIG
jgi:demethylspheroidene O-methyltransferase